MTCRLDLGGSGLKYEDANGILRHIESLLCMHQRIVEIVSKSAADRIAISISGDVQNRHYVGWLEKAGIPANLGAQLASEFKVQVFMEGDAICWAAGLSHAFAQEIGNTPCLCLVFGTGIASALVDEEGGIMSLDLLSLPSETMKSLAESFPEYSPVAEGIHNSMAHCFKEYLLLQGLPIAEVGRRLAERWSALMTCLLQGADEPWCVLVGGGLTNLVQAEDLQVPAPHKVFMTTDPTLGMHGAWLLSGFGAGDVEMNEAEFKITNPAS